MVLWSEARTGCINVGTCRRNDGDGKRESVTAMVTAGVGWASGRWCGGVRAIVTTLAALVVDAEQSAYSGHSGYSSRF